MAVVLEKHVMPAAGRPAPEEVRDEDSPLDITVIFTSFPATLAALKHAGVVAHSLSRRITVLVAQVVPYPLPLTSPPVLIDWNEQRFREIAEACPVDTTVRLYLCREREETLARFLGRPSLVVLGGPRRWWRFSREKRFARKLRSRGHAVVFIETE